MYILRNLDGIVYIGATSDLRQRLKAHQEGRCRTTKRYGPMELIYYEAFRDARDAWRREKRLKEFGGSYRSLRNRLIHSAGVPPAGRAG